MSSTPRILTITENTSRRVTATHTIEYIFEEKEFTFPESEYKMILSTSNVALRTIATYNEEILFPPASIFLNTGLVYLTRMVYLRAILV